MGTARRGPQCSSRHPAVCVTWLQNGDDAPSPASHSPPVPSYGGLGQGFLPPTASPSSTRSLSAATLSPGGALPGLAEWRGMYARLFVLKLQPGAFHLVPLRSSEKAGIIVP